MSPGMSQRVVRLLPHPHIIRNTNESRRHPCAARTRTRPIRAHRTFQDVVGVEARTELAHAQVAVAEVVGAGARNNLHHANLGETAHDLFSDAGRERSVRFGAEIVERQHGQAGSAGHGASRARTALHDCETNRQDERDKPRRTNEYRGFCQRRLAIRRAQLVGEFLERTLPLLRFARQRACDHSIKRTPDPGSQRAQRRCCFQPSCQDRHVRRTLERLTAGQHLVGHTGQTVEVAALINARFPGCLLGTHVRRRTQHGPRHGVVGGRLR